MQRFRIETDPDQSSYAKIVCVDDQAQDIELRDLALFGFGTDVDPSTHPRSASEFFDQIFRSEAGRPEVIVTDYDLCNGPYTINLDYILDLAAELGIQDLPERLQHLYESGAIKSLLIAEGVNYAFWLKLLGYEAKIVLNTSSIPAYKVIAEHLKSIEEILNIKPEELFDALVQKDGNAYCFGVLPPNGNGETYWNLQTATDSIFKTLPDVVRRLLSQSYKSANS